MSATFYDLLKFAKTGIASPSMTAYDKLKALSMCKAGFPVKTLTGVPPISFKSDGSALTAWSVSGNMSQTGTPTPTVPITPEECGDKTANLCGYLEQGGVNTIGNFVESSKRVRTSFIDVEPNAKYTISCSDNVLIRIGNQYTTNDASGLISSIYNDVDGTNLFTFTTNSTAKYIVLSFMDSGGANITPSQATGKIMLNTGSTALDYEPFGYKIPITLAGQTQNIYLSEPLRKIGDYGDTVEQDGTVTRRVKKLVLTGTEEWYPLGTGGHSFRCDNTEILKPASNNDPFLAICSHYGITTFNKIYDGSENGVSYAKNVNYLAFCDSAISAVDAWKSYLSTQYAANTPVCVWYVLQTPTTATVTVPTLTPTKGSNTLSIGTTLQPSEVSITGGIK